MSAERIWLTRPQTDEAEIDEIREVLASGTLTQGPKVVQLESMVAGLVGTRHAFATTSATTALHLTLAALGIGPGDEVLVPDFTFPATANVVAQQRATPVLVDIELERFGLDAADLDARVTSRTKAIIPVHAFGLAADMDPILEVAARHELVVIEDAACALGATYGGREAGTFGTAGCFSFHPRKSITTGEGGMITTSDDALADRIRLLRSHGGVREENRFTFEAAGFNYRMSDILAAVGVAQMRKLPAFLEARRRVAGWYAAALADVASVRLPTVPAGSEHTYHSDVVLLDEDLDRDQTIRRLRDDQIETTLGTYALHVQPYFSRSYGYRPGDRPRSRRAFDSSLALPLYGAMTEGDVARVADRLQAALAVA
jgi:perosamine synthetase